MKQCALHAVAASLVRESGATPSLCVPKCGQRDSAPGRGCDALRDGGLRGFAASERDRVAPGDGELRVSAFPGSERDAL